MPNYLGFSVCQSSFEHQKAVLSRWADTGASVFISLHTGAEWGDDYCREAENLCCWLADKGFRIIADVCKDVLVEFGERDLLTLAKRLHIWALRIDYGLTTEEIITLAREMPIVINASTTAPREAAKIAAEGKLVMAMHNFYPRPETGLDEEYLLESTRALQAVGLKVLAFIPGDQYFRGPVGEGLPTLECHRGQAPSACYEDLVLRFGMDGIFLGDPVISEEEQSRIRRFCETGVVELPCDLDEPYRGFYGITYTSRVDSPSWLIRFAESRIHSCPEKLAVPGNCGPRSRGAITLDNIRYPGYTGEIQLMKRSFPADDRVNVIGHLKTDALLAADAIQRGTPFMLVEA